MTQTEQSVIGLGGLHLATSTGFIVAAVIVFFIFVFLLCLRAKRHRGANHVFPTEPAAVVAQRPGLQAAASEVLPSMVFRCEGFKQGSGMPPSASASCRRARKHGYCSGATMPSIYIWFCYRSAVARWCSTPRNPPILGSQGVSWSSSGSCAVVAEIAVGRHESIRAMHAAAVRQRAHRIYNVILRPGHQEA
ncbi:hypothetical protein OPV22_019961 [Ensete ventricosum]|uniref:Uncharacterized protein n=1 Tax=Ensete ventricosum TaxID=4639 RepID=A0AAV8QI83_ENSVE|nr:hypothetical protein OPV22_019961 [Ensete ventricosum]